MTQNNTETVTGLIEKLESLPRYAHDYGGMICTEVPIETCVWVNIHDIRAIINEHKADFVTDGNDIDMFNQTLARINKMYVKHD